MAATVSLQFRQMLLQSFFMRDIQVGDPQLHVALTNRVPLANESGLTIEEPTAGAYQRAQIELSSEWWGLSGFGEVYNVVDIDFPPFDPGDDWGYLMGWALLDSPTSGITLAVGSLIQPVIATSDMPPISLQPGGIFVGLYD